MSTLADAMNDATAAENRATDALNAAADLLRNKAASAQAVIDGFVARPALLALFIDAVNGNDANDGSTPALAKKTADAVLALVGSNPVEIRMLSDLTIRKRYNLFAPLSFTGVTPSANAAGFDFAQRTLSFLGLAENSPSPIIGTYCAGFQIYGPAIRTAKVNFALPDVASNLNIRSHFTVLTATAFAFDTPTITVVSAQAGALVGVAGGRATVTASPIFGSGATGHLFDGVAAGGNPNSQWSYASNITSA